MKLISLNKLQEESVSHNPEIKKKVFVRKGEVLNITQIAEITFQSGQIADEHKHPDMFEMFLVQTGDGQVKVDGEVISMEKGSCVVVSPGEMHEVKNVGEDQMQVLVIGIEVMNKKEVG